MRRMEIERLNSSVPLISSPQYDLPSAPAALVSRDAKRPPSEAIWAFCEAAKQETATVELVQRVITEVERAQ